MTPQITAVDHFAGTGWAVACRWLGILEYGVEIMKEAIFTRRAVGFRTIYRDVWSGLLHAWLVPFHDLYIASPPCQTFSVAGRGTGRKALEMVLMLIASGAWKDPSKLRAAGAELGDDRTALVLTPLAHIWAHRPRLVALEQVPTVLPVWEAMAEVLRGLGYSVWTGNLQAEQFGVPQTRKRAILMARLDGPVAPPVPTHSRYYSHDPERLDPGVQKWVSMSEALGWDRSDRIGFPRLADGQGGVVVIGDAEYRARDLRSADEPSFVVTEKGRSWSRYRADGSVERVSASDASTLQSYPWGFTDRPAMTVHGHGLLTRGPSGQKQAIAAGLESGTFVPRPPYTLETARKPGEQRDDYVSLSDRYEPDAVNFTVEEAAILQSYPLAFLGAGGGAQGRIGQRPRAIDEPAHTVTGARSAAFLEGGAWRQANPGELATLQSYPSIEMRPELEQWRWIDAPATTVAGDPRITAREHHDHGEQSGTSLKLEPLEAARFQTFPTPFPFQGTRGKQFLQIGNAVPPLLAFAILQALIAPVVAPAAPVVDEHISEWDRVFAEVLA